MPTQLVADCILSPTCRDCSNTRMCPHADDMLALPDCSAPFNFHYTEGPCPPLSREAAGFDTRSVAHDRCSNLASAALYNETTTAAMVACWHASSDATGQDDIQPPCSPHNNSSIGQRGPADGTARKTRVRRRSSRLRFARLGRPSDALSHV